VASIEDLIGRVGRPTRSVRLCLDGALLADWEQAEADLAAADRMAGMSLAGSGDRGALAERVRELEAQMREHEETFTFRGLGMYELSALQSRHPAKPGTRGWDIESGAAELVAATCIEPKMTVDQTGRLLDALSHGQADRLITAAWAASTGGTDVPFSVRASERIHTSEQ
jgi:hypothetical protein